MSIPWFEDERFYIDLWHCNSRKTKANKTSWVVPRPKVAEEYLKNSASIDVHNHYRTGSCGFEDIWHTKNPHRRQLAGILGFCFTNSFLAMKYFTGQKNLQHHSFKMAAANALVSVSLSSSSIYGTRSLLDNSIESILHEMERIGYSLDCYYCSNGYKKKVRTTTTFKCKGCDIPLCRPSKGQCWDLHIKHGKPKKRPNKRKK